MSNTLVQKLLQAAHESQDLAPDNTDAVAATPVAPAEDPSQDIAELVESRHAAVASKEYVNEVREVGDGLNDLRETVELANEHHGGLTMQSFAFMQLALNGLTKRIGFESLDLIPSLEGMAPEDRTLVSLEELNTLISTVQEGTSRLEARSVEAVTRLIEALSESLPTACERLNHVIELAKAKEEEVEGNVVFGDGLHVALAVDGQIPDDLVAYLQRYALLGQALLGKYAPAAFKAAMDVSTLPESLDFRSVELFWKSLQDKLQPVEDPRANLTEDQLVMALPNGTALFGEKKPAEMPEGGAPVLKQVLEFTDSRVVNEQTNIDAEKTKVESGQPGYGRKGMALQDIRVIARSLEELLCMIDVGQLGEQGKAVRSDVIGAVSSLKNRYAEASVEIKMGLADHFGMVTKYLDTAYMLSDWPVLNYLSNLVFTTNAFVLYAERSLALPEGAVPDEAPEAPPAAEPTAVDPNAPPTDPAAPPADGADVGADAGEGEDDPAEGAAGAGATATDATPPADNPEDLPDDPPDDPNAAPVEGDASADDAAGEGEDDPAPADDTAGLAADNRSSDEIDPAAAATGTEPPAPGAAEDTAPDASAAGTDDAAGDLGTGTDDAGAEGAEGTDDAAAGDAGAADAGAEGADGAATEPAAAGGDEGAEGSSADDDDDDEEEDDGAATPAA